MDDKKDVQMYLSHSIRLTGMKWIKIYAAFSAISEKNTNLQLVDDAIQHKLL